MAFDDDEFTALAEHIPELIGSHPLGGRYELGKLLGSGAFGKVYLARHIHTHQIVAIKCICKNQVVAAGLATQVKTEISVMRRLRHPNIVKLRHAMATRTKIYLVMEFEEGGALFDQLSRKGPFSEDLSRKYFRQLISAVSYCHAQGVFHRDLKPENLLLDRNSNLKISDFGLSAVKDEISSDGLLHKQCGTPAYMAPERLDTKGYEGAKIDVWSCGVTLFVFIAGYLPFNDPNMEVMYQQIRHAKFTFPYWTSPDTRRFIRRLLDPNPATRITVSEIINDPWFTKRSDQYSDVTNNNALDTPSQTSLIIPDQKGIVERFVSQYSPGKIREIIEGVARGEGWVVTRRREWGMKLEGKDGGDLIVSIRMDPLTLNLVNVVVREGQAADVVVTKSCRKLWYTRISPKLEYLVCQNNSLKHPTRSF